MLIFLKNFWICFEFFWIFFWKFSWKLFKTFFWIFYFLIFYFISLNFFFKLIWNVFECLRFSYIKFFWGVKCPKNNKNKNLTLCDHAALPQAAGKKGNPSKSVSIWKLYITVQKCIHLLRNSQKLAASPPFLLALAPLNQKHQPYSQLTFLNKR